MENHNLDLTPKEHKVLEALIGELYAEAGFSDVDANDLARITGIPTKNIRGVLSSLVKKGIISLNETDNAWADKQYVIISTSEWNVYTKEGTGKIELVHPEDGKPFFVWQ